MKYIITEEQSKKYLRLNPNIVRVVEKYLDNIINTSSRFVSEPEWVYGNLREDYCYNGTEIITVLYYFEDDQFQEGSLFIYHKIVRDIMESFNLRRVSVLNVILDWYEDKYLPRMIQETGDNNLSILDIDLSEHNPPCKQVVDISNVTKDQMINYIEKHTLYGLEELSDWSDDEIKNLYISKKHDEQQGK